jgi:hypothetical protein
MRAAMPMEADMTVSEALEQAQAALDAREGE